jgi:hypothetical protein
VDLSGGFVPGNSDDEKRKVPAELYKDVPPAQVAMGPAGISSMIGPPAALPPASPAHFICLRGPCRHYWRMETFMASGNPKDTWDPEKGLKDADGNPVRMPRQVHHTCLVQPGMETELTEDNVYECSRWEPLTPREVKRIDKKRRVYLKLHPDHEPRS